ncbi:hypothetical protein [Actibacterium lipolyticum]|uniref:Uncharacterized protein n=1 Tax=Actibacterium lipolyticum TaxID=1524263 RepID=A0A238JP00_9RHOB|nr:hypothetical protein [Actibacterium lipolyticum]SMX31924.1 hypothetical protein COL8621_00651 [Actibacterium lipolyticum]
MSNLLGFAGAARFCEKVDRAFVNCEDQDANEPERKKTNKVLFSAHRLILTRARADLAVFFPEGSDKDEMHQRYDFGDTFGAIQKSGASALN